MGTPRFWFSSGVAAALVAATWALGVRVVAWLEPRAGLRAPGGFDLWLLGVFTAGVLALLLGLSLALGGRLPGARAKEALLGTAEANDAEGSMPGAAWILAVGAELLLIYAAGWLITA